MLAWLITGVGLGLEFLLLLRGSLVRLLSKYYFFYIYCLSAMLGTVVGMAVLLKHPVFYEKWYWTIQLLTLVTGYGILLEIMNHVLAPYPGAERFARVMGVSAFVLIFFVALVSPWIMPHASHGGLLEFERDLRCVQSLFICGLFAVILYYGVGVGQNMKGMMVGYGVYIASSLVSLAFRSYAGRPLGHMWMTVQPLSLDLSMLIWLIALWSYCPNPAPEHTIHLEEDYEALALRTRSVMDAIRTHLRKAERA